MNFSSFAPSFNSSVLKCYHAPESPAELVKTRVPGPTPEFWVQLVWGGAQDFAFLVSFRMMLVLMAQGLPIKNPVLIQKSTGTRVARMCKAQVKDLCMAPSCLLSLMMPKGPPGALTALSRTASSRCPCSPCLLQLWLVDMPSSPGAMPGSRYTKGSEDQKSSSQPKIPLPFQTCLYGGCLKSCHYCRVSLGGSVRGLNPRPWREDEDALKV